MVDKNTRGYQLGKKEAEVFEESVNIGYQTNTARNRITGFMETVYKKLKGNENFREKGIEIEEIWKKILEDDGELDG